jgi:hypothetical protein
MRIGSKWPLTAAALGAAAVFASQCGGATKTNDTDASADGSSGSSGASSGSSSGGGSGSSGSGGSSGADGSSSGGQCKCKPGDACCGGQCTYILNDPHNCGGCGIQCTGNTPFCDGNGKCQPPPPCTMDGSACASPATCCGSQCCDTTQICCEPDGPLDMGPVCQTPTGNPPTCMPGCAPQCASDRNIKRDIEPVDEQAVLEAVARMPVSTWSYKSDDPSVRHMGPMAQDFKAAFDLGDTDKAYHPVDAHGVALAAIQALYERVQSQEARIDRLERDNERLRAACK